MTEIEKILGQLTAIRDQLKRERASNTNMLIYMVEIALAETRDVRNGIRRQLPKDR